MGEDALIDDEELEELLKQYGVIDPEQSEISLKDTV